MSEPEKDIAEFLYEDLRAIRRMAAETQEEGKMPYALDRIELRASAAIRRYREWQAKKEEQDAPEGLREVERERRSVHANGGRRVRHSVGEMPGGSHRPHGRGPQAKDGTKAARRGHGPKKDA
jgi:hypothetical protein